MKKLIGIFIAISIVIGSISLSQGATGRYPDVPVGNWAESYINRVSDLKIMGGYPNGRFGLGDSLTRSQFAAMLVRLFGWTKVSPQTPSFKDNMDKNQWYYQDVETAVAQGAILKDGLYFRPGDKITREEMAMMLVRGLGFDALGTTVSTKSLPFGDVTTNKGYITMAYEFGIINGRSATTFDPKGYAKREEAAAMMIRLYDAYYAGTDWLHGFYAISSYSQKEIIPSLDALSFGWSKMEYSQANGPVLNTTSAGNNEYNIPSGYEEVVGLVKSEGVPANLNVYMTAAKKIQLSDGSTSDGCQEILLNPDMRQKAIDGILAELTREGNYSGVTIDFEEMKGSALKEGYNEFLKTLRTELDSLGLSLYVCVPPVMSNGIYFDGYDYKTIGQYADKVILMAHDYQATTIPQTLMDAGFTTTPLTPIQEIFFGLNAITDPQTGVADKSKIALAFSFGAVQWTIKDNKVTNGTALKPAPSSISKRLVDPGTTMNYSEKYQNPYLTFQNADATSSILWYEDVRSVAKKVELARMFGVTGISLWRLGIVPNYPDVDQKAIQYDVLSYLLEQRLK